MHELTIDSLAFGGDAVGRLDGKVVFVPFGAPGDRLRVRLLKQSGSYLRGEILELLSPGECRRPPACRYFGSCGGCQWQQVGYREQVVAKQEIFIHAMAEAGVETIETILPCPRELRYRRRARLQLRLVPGASLQLGYFRWRSRELLEVESCPLLEEPLDQGLALARRALAPLRAATVVGGTLAILLGRDGALHLSLRIDAGEPPSRELERLLSRLLDEGFAGAVVACGAQALRGGVASVELGGEAGSLHGSAVAFAQANAEQDAVLRSQVRGLCRAEGARVLELHAGTGNLTQVLAMDAREVLAVESFAGAAELLLRNLGAVQSGCATGVRAQDAVTVCAALAGQSERFELALLDPPREGCPKLPPLLDRLGVERVVYVSCDPMTLARDLSLFARVGLRARCARAIDMMPQSYHLEAVALLER